MDQSRIVHFLDSGPVKTAIALLGAAAALAKLLDLAAPAVIKPAATVLLVLVGVYAAWLVIRALFSVERRTSAEAVYRYMARRYGVGYRRADIAVEIKDDGSGTYTRVIDLQAFSEIADLDTFLVIGEPSPPGESRIMDLIDVVSLSSGRDVSKKSKVSKDGTLSVLAAFAPQLDPGDSVAYRMSEALPAGLFAVNLTGEQLAQRATPYDYFGFTINRPTRSMSLRVMFPQGMRPLSYRVEVKRASAAPGIPSPEIQVEEQRQLRKEPLRRAPDGRWELTLDVDCPMTGLVYLWRWEPPAKPA